MTDASERCTEVAPKLPARCLALGALAALAAGLSGCGSDMHVLQRGRDGLTLCAAMTSIPYGSLDQLGRDHCARFGQESERQPLAYFSCGSADTGVTVRYACVPPRPLRPARSP